MPRNVGTVINNNLSRGLITEATGINFPENAVTDSDNVVFERIGNVTRRLGIDLEGSAASIDYDTDDGLIQEFVWEAVSRTGGFTFLVMQVGELIYFFELQDGGLSGGVQGVNVDLSDYKTPGSGEIKSTPASLAAGAGYLFVSHPYTDPIIVRWNEDTGNFEAARIKVYVRDFEGLDDGLDVNENPSTLSSAHHYNLKNQGWNQQVRVGSVNNEKGAGGPVSGTPNIPDLNWSALS